MKAAGGRGAAAAKARLIRMLRAVTQASLSSYRRQAKERGEDALLSLIAILCLIKLDAARCTRIAAHTAILWLAASAIMGAARSTCAISPSRCLLSCGGNDGRIKYRASPSSRYRSWLNCELSLHNSGAKTTASRAVCGRRGKRLAQAKAPPRQLINASRRCTKKKHTAAGAP